MNLRDQLFNLMNNGELELGSTHKKLCLPIIERIYKKMILNLRFGSIQIDEGVILNGHHRYLASKLANFNLDRIQGIRSSAKELIDWQNVILVEEDWDTEAKIRLLNEEDARLNEMSLEELLALLDT
ncbi:hypothetical protein [Algoriphagus taiwanensis]|uniref:ParB/Sulfiredoxin domain-containing protein n=1 Tax=Algoriphagus taiwanensis TaxID=1445656 RepID=A0ABQ6Q7M4_9BACT|nr:hypothetical protein Ataiwa_38010 [Algoriphagus taiwanensis]